MLRSRPCFPHSIQRYLAIEESLVDDYPNKGFRRMEFYLDQSFLFISNLNIMNIDEQLNYKLFIGIDVSKKTIDVAIVCDMGKKLGHKKFTNNSLGFESCLE